MKRASNELLSRVSEYAAEHDGIYAPIMHPDFAEYPTHHGHDRFEIMSRHLRGQRGTLLDLGSHWGYFAHRFEEMGFDVTAAEHSPEHLYFLREIRNLCGKRFEIYGDSFYKMQNPVYDVVLALNIFHHYLRKEVKFKQLNGFLARLKTKTVILQTHSPTESQMQGAFHYLDPEPFAEYIAGKLGLKNVTRIGATGGRSIYKLS